MMDFHDCVSSLTHLAMGVWCLFVALILWRLTQRHPLTYRLSILFYALSAVLLYFASGLFHGIRHSSPYERRYWQLLDQSAIFGLIFGSNLPLYAYLLSRKWCARLLIMMAGVGLSGVAMLWLYPLLLGSPPPHTALIAVYLLMGLLGLLPIHKYYERIGFAGLFWVGALSSSYVVGAVCEALSWPVIIPGWFGYHEILHIFDMLGTLAHLVLLLRYVLPWGDPNLGTSRKRSTSEK